MRRRDSLLRIALAGADALAVALTVAVSTLALGDDRLTLGAFVLPILFVTICKAVGLYDRDEHLLHKTTLDESPILFGVSTLTALLLFLSDGLLVEGELGRRQILGAWILLFLLTVCFRSIARLLATRLSPAERCVLLGDPSRADEIRQKLSLTRTAKADLVGVFPSANGHRNGSRDNHGARRHLEQVLASQEIDRVILATRSELTRDELLYVVRDLKSHGVNVSVLPEASRIAGSSVELDHLHGTALLGVRRFEITKSSQLIKRSLDLLGAILLVVVLSPLMMAIAIAIKLSSRGPVVFIQLRVGKAGECFRMFKFRTMFDGADGQKDGLRHLNEADGVFKIAEDPRMTRLGRRLRRTHLDELPQLFNVIRGEMSLVGPRPLPLDEDRAIQGWHRERLDVRPGITGYWQVLGSARIPVDEMVRLDYLYVANWSPWGDLKLLLRTIPAVVCRRGL